MKLIINVPKGRLEDYLEQVRTDVHNGMTSGHWDAETHWESTEDD